MPDLQKRLAIGLGLLGLILIVLGLKYMPAFLAAIGSQMSREDGPVVLFFNEDNPCECSLELAQSADTQMEEWAENSTANISVQRLAFRQHRDLELKYHVFRSPCLILVDAQDQEIWRQDYPLIEGGPFKLEELETAIAELGK